MGLPKALADLFHAKKTGLNTEQEEMIKGVVELPEITAKEVMVPRTDTVFVAADMGREELLKTITESGHSRFPVYEDTIDNVTGVLYVKDILSSIYKSDCPIHGDGAGAAEIDIKALLRKPFFVPLSKHIDELMREMRRRRVHIAVVVDEYGGVAGIVCMEDIIEEIIGDIQDEFDNEKEDVVRLGEGEWLCDARVNLEDLSDALSKDISKDMPNEPGLELPVDDFDSLGGFVFDLLGKIPVKYEKVRYQGYDFIVQEMEGHRINSVKIVAPSEGKE